jgi:5-methyltetrahydrofolate--homocysteine methyltransferase
LREEIGVERTAEISQSLQQGDRDRVTDLTRTAITEGIDTIRILNDGLIGGMQVVGDRFRRHEIFLPDVLLAAWAMTAAMELLKPLLIRDGVPGRGRVVLGTVQGDLHDIGRNLVGIMLQGAGFEVVDLGHDVAPVRFVDTAVAEGSTVIGLSALLTTTMPVMKQVIELVRDRGLQGQIRVIVGGAPVTESFAHDIGADAYGFDALGAVERVQSIMDGEPA